MPSSKSLRGDNASGDQRQNRRVHVLHEEAQLCREHKESRVKLLKETVNC